MKALIYLLSFYTLCSVVVTAKNDTACVNKYHVVNSFMDIEEIQIYCYSEASSCEISYSPPGLTVPPVVIGSVPANQTKAISYEIAFGGRLHSNHQIGAQYLRYVNTQAEYSVSQNTLVQLPRAPDAGTKFAPYFSFGPLASGYRAEQCSFAALTEPAVVSYQYGNDAKESFDIESYQISSKQIVFSGTENFTIRVTSTSPIIISCFNSQFDVFKIWQPITNEPIFSYLSNTFLTITLSDCETNEEIFDFSKVNIEYSGIYSSKCMLISGHSLTANDTLTGSKCGILVTALDNKTCVTMTNQDLTSSLINMGWPISKTIWRSFNLGFLQSYRLTSLGNSNCIASDINMTKTTPLINQVYEGDIPDQFNPAYRYNIDPIYDYVECDHASFIYSEDHFSLKELQSLGHQSEDVWKPFFTAEGCLASSEAPLKSCFLLSTWISLCALLYSLIG